MTFQHIADRAMEQQIDVVGITDHLMGHKDIALLKQTREELLRFRANCRSTTMLFGVEVCEIGPDGSTLLDAHLADELGFELVIGGVHETHMHCGASLADVAVTQHRHHIMMMENPLIEILVHPWWLDRNEFERLGIAWPDDMSFIPEALSMELAHASRRTNTCIEISTMSGFRNADTSARFKHDLLAYYQLLNREGALFAIGSDAHELSEMGSFADAVQIIKMIGIGEDRLWQPKTKRIGGDNR